jgi:mediator of RNA polymerase II transcription subunit 12
MSAAPQFVQPSKLYFKASRTASPHQNRGTRQKQIQLQPSKAEVTKNNASRRDKLKPYVLEPTPQAQRYPQSSTQHSPPQGAPAWNSRSTECCDFYPWRGNHAEDHVSAQQAKTGHSDKLLYNKNVHTTGLLQSQSDLVLTALQQEQQSARQSLGLNFKQRNGLPWLSYLYKEIMARRQQYSTVTTPSTFKPPPRVTLPEQKREAWLRDLANPLVPLRKLSRTIPHGLKGPPLLDQCAAKKIPTARAVWFVRCVGANELRGLRRKGVGSLAVGGESKWIKEWTGQLTQFLEKTVGACVTMPDDLWQSKMHYS